ncbi:MAG: hypothetical protein V4659_04065 [Pseudomonadota bacterium]
MTEHPSFADLPPGEPIEGKTYRADGWAYIDPPGRFSPEAWADFLAMFGAGQAVILALSAGRTIEGAPWRRGQILISPEGMRAAGAAAEATLIAKAAAMRGKVQ